MAVDECEQKVYRVWLDHTLLYAFVQHVVIRFQGIFDLLLRYEGKKRRRLELLYKSELQFIFKCPVKGGDILVPECFFKRRL